jgi:hypothetical protein
VLWKIRQRSAQCASPWCRDAWCVSFRLTAAKDRTFKTVRPNQRTITGRRGIEFRCPYADRPAGAGRGAGTQIGSHHDECRHRLCP